MKVKLLFIFALLLTAVTGAFADFPQPGDVWDDATKTLTVKSNPGEAAYRNNTEIQHLVIASGVTTIGEVAFASTGLTSIEIAASVTTIDNFAFQECSDLATVTFATGSKLKTIGVEAFGSCKSLNSVTIPASVTTIGNGAFISCTGLKTVTFDSGSKLETIGNAAFDRTGLTSINIPASVTTIGNGAFTYCSQLVTMTVDAGNAKYDSRNDCNAIIEKKSNTLIAGCKSSFIPDDVTAIGDIAFFYCTGLTSITIPSSVTSIGWSAFSGCAGLTTVTFATGSQLKTISDQAFVFCTGLTSIEIPASVESIGDLAFQECSDLATVTFDSGSQLKTIGKQAFNGTGLTSINIPAGVTSIGDAAFYGCKELTAIEIPASVTLINDRTFQNCSSLNTITLNSNPYIGTDVFDGIASGATVTMNLTGHEGATGEYWMTFYNKNCHFSVPSTTQVFKAALTDKSLTLTELTSDKTVSQNNAVILKSTSANITLAYQTSGSSNDFSGNQLLGVSDPAGLVGDGTIYVLGNGNGGVGFYKLSTTGNLGVGKAYLTYSGGGSRNFFGFEESETTSIDGRWKMEDGRSDVYYDLNGRRVLNPTKKGIYIVNGKKVVVK